MKQNNIQIKFSFEYPKLWNQTTATLLKIYNLDYNSLPKPLIEYDTKIDKKNYYELPKTDLILLVFIGNFLIPFTTLREYTSEKYAYYMKNLGKEFDVVVENGD